MTGKGKLTSLPVVIDGAVGAGGDRFGHGDFADALCELVSAKHHRPPFSVGLLGQ